MRAIRVPWWSYVSRAGRDVAGADVSVNKALRWLAVVASIGMCLVLQQGTLVTNSGSAAGCGNTWPLCHGKILPEFSGVGGAATAIEFSHRAAVPVESTLVILLAVGILWCWRYRREAPVLAPAMIFFLFLQAVLGAMAVAWPTSAEVLAAHFGISLLAFASIVLTMAFVWELGGAEALRDWPLSAGIRWAVRGLLLYTYIVVYLGHMCGTLVPAWRAWTGLCVTGRWYLRSSRVSPHNSVTASAPASSCCSSRVCSSRSGVSGPSVRISIGPAQLVSCLSSLQALSGALVVETRVAVASTLLHAFIVSLLFVVEAYMWLHTIELPAGARSRSVVAKRLAAQRGPRTTRA